LNGNRYTPGAYLRLIERSGHGRLKIYIGHAAGTGKTVRMLREGHDLLRQGKNVLGAFIETHGRKGTESEIGDLPMLPRKEVVHKGTVLQEMDVEEVIRRHPDVALVDELAHTNAPGSHRAKRYEDVEDLIDHGINVITALNIQHIDSLNPVIEKLTGVKVRETVPDSFISSADEIVNLDLAVDDLRDRIRRGEVYSTDKIDSALTNFFTETNLAALRELALREVTHHIDEARRERPTAGAAYTGADGEGTDSLLIGESAVDPVVMVAMSSRPPDVRNLLRKAAAIANRLNTCWYLVYVETPRESSRSIDATTLRILLNNMSLAKDLGATVVRIKGSDVSKALADFAKEYGVTHAIFGVSHRPASYLFRLTHLLKPGIIERFSQWAPGVDMQLCGT